MQPETSMSHSLWDPTSIHRGRRQGQLKSLGLTYMWLLSSQLLALALAQALAALDIGKVFQQKYHFLPFNFLT